MSCVRIERCSTYEPADLEAAIGHYRPLFQRTLRKGDTVALKPNWIAASHKHRPDEWTSVITHPMFLSAVLKEVVACLDGTGRVIIADGPQTDQSFSRILARCPVAQWRALCEAARVELEILDLRDHEWVTESDVLVSRKNLPGDPRGSVQFNLGNSSEFCAHTPSSLGYYGADYDTAETTAAHSNGTHLYRVARSMIAADVFINLPKWKTHKKAGITCSLKNLVGINTYKNFLPHHTEGTPQMGGDQFPSSEMKRALETRFLRIFKQAILRYPAFSRPMKPLKWMGRKLFGETTTTIRNGSWFGNDTLWRTILDLNKILLYGNSDGTMRTADLNKKRYLSFVDGIVAGEGNGPEAPDALHCGLIIGGIDPVAVDCAAARLMGFDYLSIPALRHAFDSIDFPLADGPYLSIEAESETESKFQGVLAEIPEEYCRSFRPHFGWVGHIELSRMRAAHEGN
jgi:uncharacterized protein (DUF362 family)